MGNSDGMANIRGVAAMLHPKNVVVIGASDKPGNWSMRVWRNLNRYKYPNPIYPVNPIRDEIWDRTCYRSIAGLPETPDHVIVMVPAKHVATALREAGKAGARSATVFASGFGEVEGAEGKRLAAELGAAIADSGLAVSGPNCLGNWSAPASLMTQPDDRLHSTRMGPVAIVGQSGGILMSIKRTLEERGVDCGYMVTSGNEAGLNSADYISYFAEADGVRAIVSYVEGLRGDPQRYIDAVAKARAAGRPVIVLKLGASPDGRKAALAHTGALAGSLEAFDAVAGAVGAIRVRNMDDVVEAVEYVVHAKLPAGPRAGAITLSGGMRGLLLDAGHAHGVRFEQLALATTAKLEKILGVGTIIGNPLDAGFAALTSPQALFQSVEALLDDPAIDVLLVQEELPRGAATAGKESNMRTINEIAARAKKPVGFVSMISHGCTDYSREFREGVRNLPFLQECDKTVRVLSAIARGATQRPVVRAARMQTPAQKSALQLLKDWRGPQTLDEVTSKAILGAYGIAPPREELARDEAHAVEIAQRIGFPVVAKAVSPALPHKSDAGGVIIGLDTADDVAAAYRHIVAAVAKLDPAPALDGVLIARMERGGVELVLGAHRDPEVGMVMLFGAGGVDLEVERDVALAALPLDEAAALGLVDRTRIAHRIAGSRGRAALDRKALAAALVGLSDLVTDAGSLIQSVDVNPFLLRESGGVALDGLIVLQGSSRPA